MIISPQKLYFHMPINRLLNGLGDYLSLNVNCEICINSDFLDNYKPEEIEQINTSFKRRNIFKRIHGPFMDICPGSSDKKVRDLSQERILSAIKLCSMLQCNDIVLHSHYDPVYHKRHFNEWFNLSKIVWDNVNAQAKKNNITVYIENSEDDTPEAIIAILKEYPLFRACFDLAHYTVFGTCPWREILRSYPKGSIGEVHLSDNDRKEDLHLVLGEGSVDIEPFLEEIDTYEEKPVVTIEPHSNEDLLTDMEYIKKFQIP